MRNLRPEKIDSRASKASDAASPQRLRACVEAVSHRQRRSTNPPRLKSSAGKGKPGQHNKQSTSHHPAFQQTNPLLAPRETTAPKPCKTRKLHPTGATSAHPPTKTVRNNPYTFPTSRTTGTSGTLTPPSKAAFHNTEQTIEPNHPTHR